MNYVKRLALVTVVVFTSIAPMTTVGCITNNCDSNTSTYSQNDLNEIISKMPNLHTIETSEGVVEISIKNIHSTTSGVASRGWFSQAWACDVGAPSLSYEATIEIALKPLSGDPTILFESTSTKGNSIYPSGNELDIISAFENDEVGFNIKWRYLVDNSFDVSEFRITKKTQGTSIFYYAD